MEQIIDVEYKEVENLENKTTDQLATEANTLWHQMEAISNIGLILIAQAGRRLQVIKERLQHGEWEDWCSDNLDFSKSKAEKMMLASAKMDDVNSIFAKTETFTDIGISKIYALLSAPEEVAEEIINNPNAADMSVRELKEEIRRLKEESEQKNDTVNSLSSQIEAIQAEIKEKSDRQPDEETLKKLQAEITSLEEKLSKEKDKAKKVKDQAEQDKTKAIDDAVKKAKEEAITEAEVEGRSLKSKLEENEKTIERLERSLANNENKELAIFKVKSDTLQQNFNSCLESISTVNTQNQEQASKMKQALRTVMEAMLKNLEE